MKDPERIKPLLAKIEKIWTDNPELRLGQLICNAVPAELLYNTPDDELSDTLEDVYGPIEID